MRLPRPHVRLLRKLRARTGTTKIPPAARVRAYPIEERYGLVWIWMGSPEQASADTIFAVEEWDDPAWGMNQGMQ